LEHAAVNRIDEGRSFLQAGRAQATRGIYYKFKDTHQRIIQEEVISKAGRIMSGFCWNVIKGYDKIINN